MISDKRKELIHTVMNDNIKLVNVMHQLTHYVHCDKFLSWLIRNNITGMNLEQWLMINFKNSIMSMVQYIIKVSENNSEFKPIIFNKDWIS
ncbi:hypothetical protein KAR91_40830 [Candidatus Pacearchaeota archaeon]|nr:hypothetical protein [Candidatus Pacearchaeota archaeon]